MENRYKLPKSIQRQYFQTIEKRSGLTQDQLASIFHIVPRSYRDWRRGKFAIPQHVIKYAKQHFHVSFPISKITALKKWKNAKFVASQRGGVAVSAKYGGPGTPEGRSKGGKRGIQVLRERGLIPEAKPFIPPDTYSADLAEFVGILLGDGHIDKTQWTITLNMIKDKSYANFVTKLITSLFHFHPSRIIRKNYHAIIISGSGIRSIQYFLQIGLKIGNKVKQQVGVPNWITQNKTYRIACLRGLTDTDGGVFRHAYTVNGKQYAYNKLAFINRSMPLLHFAYDVLTQSGLHPKMIDKVANKRVWLYNQSEVNRYLQIIGTHNPRLLTLYNGGVG